MIQNRDNKISAAVIPVMFILFIFLLSGAISIYQVSFVPEQGKNLEIDANRELKNQMINFDAMIRDSFDSGIPQSVNFGTSVGYSPALPPTPEPATIIKTTGEQPITIENYNCVSGVDCPSRTILSMNTSSLKVRTQYNYLQDSQRFLYEYGVAVSVSESKTTNNEAVLLTDTFIAEENNINIARFVSFQPVQQKGAVPLYVSTDRETSSNYNITGESSENITLTLPTQLEKEDWQFLLEKQTSSEQVQEINFITQSNRADLVEIILDGSETYNVSVRTYEIS